MGDPEPQRLDASVYRLASPYHRSSENGPVPLVVDEFRTKKTRLPLRTPSTTATRLGGRLLTCARVPLTPSQKRGTIPSKYVDGRCSRQSLVPFYLGETAYFGPLGWSPICCTWYMLSRVRLSQEAPRQARLIA